MVGALESARDVLNDNNFSTFLSKDYMFVLILSCEASIIIIIAGL